MISPRKKNLSIRQAILRGVREENMRLYEPGPWNRMSTRQPRRERWLAVLTMVCLFAGARMYEAHSVSEPPASGVLSAPELPRDYAAAALDREHAGGDTMKTLLGLTTRTILIDAGHGGRDPGAVGKLGTREKDVTLDVALRLKSKLAMSGQYQILLVRGDESFVALRERAVYANDRNVDLFISIHVNYLPGTSTNAVQTYYFGQFSDAASRRTAERENQRSQYTVGEFEGLAKTMANEMKLQESMALAHSIQQSLVSNLRNKNEAVLDTGVRSAPFVVLLGVKAPSVLAEIGSLSSVEAEERLRRDEYRDEIASYLASGITNYLSDTPTGATHYVESEKQPTTYR